MRKKVAFVLLFALTNHAFAQISSNRIAIPVKAKFLYWYRLTYAPDSLNSTKRTELMRLYSGKTFSEFISNGTFLSDSLRELGASSPAIFYKDDFGDKITRLVQTNPTNFRFRIYKDFSNNQLYHYERVWTTLFNYQEVLQTNHWNLTSDKSNIGGYTCQRAIIHFAGRIYEAWFTREIPVPDGPYKFCGLPGLIIKINDTRKQYVFELVKIRNLSMETTISYPKSSAKKTTMQELWKAREDLKKNMPNMVAAGASGITAEDKLKMRNRAKQDNNSIELH